MIEDTIEVMLSMNYDNYFETYSSEEELIALPVDYTLEAALINNDIIYTQDRSFHVDRLIEFLDRLNKGIPDKIRITHFDTEETAFTGVIQYNGNAILATFDTSRNNCNRYFIHYYGTHLVAQVRYQDRPEVILEDYYLVTTNRNILIFTHFMEDNLNTTSD
ncbi:MAG: hypothetical protein K0S47_4479 [Herbinix sp.]|jgi:hypothetical protein|nr:hypothetical protein [Herbinix sp.]